MLNRWVTMKQEERVGSLRRRPAIAAEATKLHEAERWRHQILREISQKVGEIHNSSLGEHRIRELNDEINRLFREKFHWERRIVELGGANYSRAPRIMDSLGREIIGPGGYKYFGEARNLPGVKELLEPPEAVEIAHKSKGEVTKNIDPDYYGFRDDEDGLLAKMEEVAEQRLIDEYVHNWKEARAEKLRVQEQLGITMKEEDDGVGDDMRDVVEQLESQFTAHVPVPDKKDVEKALLDQRKKELLAKYLSEDLVEDLTVSEQQVRAVTGRQMS